MWIRSSNFFKSIFHVSDPLTFSDIIMPPKGRTTRHSSGPASCPPCELPDANQLYTNQDILSAIRMEQSTHPESDIRHIAMKLEPLIRRKWEEVNPCLPLNQPESVKQKIIRIDDTANLIKVKKITAKKRDFFMDSLGQLFDILVCRCPFVDCDPAECNPFPCDIPHINCDCLRKFKIPEIELPFIKDQRNKVGLNGGKMIMKGVDIEIAQQQENTKKKKEGVAKQKANSLIMGGEDMNRNRRGRHQADPGEEHDQPGDVLIENEDHADEDYDVDTEENNNTTTDIKIFVSECIRYQVSDRAAVALYNAALKTLGPVESNKIVDKSKYRREKAKFGARQEVKKKAQVAKGFGCLGADGKRNKRTRVKETQMINNKEVEKFLRKTREHIVYTGEPGGEYLEHTEISEGKGTGLDLAEDFYEVIVENNSVETLEAVLCDGTAVNTGNRTGCISFLERKLKRKLLRLICQLHGNELPFRHVFDFFDGSFGTSGPTSFKGPLGQACAVDEIHLGPVVNFSPISSTVPVLPDAVLKDLSRDQNLLYRYARGISTGHLEENLIQQKPGPINHSRWLTLAIRIMICYTRTEEPTPGMIKIISFIVKVYCPGWFLIKMNHNFVHGPSNLFEQMRLIMTTQEIDVRQVAMKTVQHNAYFAEPGMMVTCMLSSTDSNIRKKAVLKIQQVRKKPPKPPRAKLFQGIRKAEVPPLQWDASSWEEMIDWDKAKVFEPFILEKLSDQDISSALDTPVVFPPYSLHSQSVERAVKLVSTASQNVCGAENRHKYCLSIIASRKARSAEALKTKKNYVVDETFL